MNELAIEDIFERMCQEICSSFAVENLLLPRFEDFCRF